MTLRTSWGAPRQRTELGLGDLVILLGILALIYLGVLVGRGAPASVTGPALTLAPQALPYYAALSLARMVGAYLLSLAFALVYGYVAAHSRPARQGLLPLLDVLQSVPILSFLPVAVLSLSAILPEGAAVELSSILLIFTSQVWNMAFSTYQSFSTVPGDLCEASAAFGLHPWLRLRLVELPFAARSLVWNSMLSWAGGWFFLIAAETFTLGARDFRLPGLGSYLQAAAQADDRPAVAWGLAALVLTILTVDQVVWRPALTWSERFRLQMVTGREEAHSWLYDVVSRAYLVQWFLERVWRPLSEGLDRTIVRLRPARPKGQGAARRPWLAWVALAAVSLALAYAAFLALRALSRLPAPAWITILVGLGATALRVAAALAIGALWAIPAGVLIGTNRRVASVAEPVVQVIASIPATALFPIIVVALISLPGGQNLAAILLMLLGTQWYILFNVIAGTVAIPQELYDMSDMLRLGSRLRWTTLILPALFPYLVTGLVTASGGAWNASIVAEYVVVGGQPFQIAGVGALIAAATENGDLVLLLAATLSLIVAVVAVNRVLWRRLYERATEQYRF